MLALLVVLVPLVVLGEGMKKVGDMSDCRALYLALGGVESRQFEKSWRNTSILFVWKKVLPFKEPGDRGAKRVERTILIQEFSC